MKDTSPKQSDQLHYWVRLAGYQAGILRMRAADRTMHDARYPISLLRSPLYLPSSLSQPTNISTATEAHNLASDATLPSPDTLPRGSPHYQSG